MTTFYYLSDMPESFVELHSKLVKEIYGEMIDEFTRAYPAENLDLYSNNKLITNDIFDLDPKRDVDEADKVVDLYMEMISRGTVLEFDKSKQCNSEYIFKQLKVLGLESEDNFKKLLILAIENYKEVMHADYLRRRKHIISARNNGHPMGAKKGVKMITKKSVEMKAKIKAMCKDFDGDMEDIKVRKELGIAKNTYFKYKRELKEEKKK